MMKTESRRAVELVVLGIIGGLLTVFLFMGAGWGAGRFEVWSGKGGWIPAETGPHAERMPFLQGGTDEGGGAMYADEAMAGVVYLVLVSWLLALWMAQVRKVSPDGAGWGKRTLRALWFFAPSRSHPPEKEEVLASASSLEDVLSGERAPVVVGIAEDVPLGALADCLQRLDAAGFDEVFVD